MAIAIQHIHSKKVLHRDLKSGNVFLTKDGIVKIGDFGIARQLDQTAGYAETVVGTPYYLSPEIVQAQEYNYKTDLWSLGVILYEMCALQPPFNGNNIAALAIQIVQGKYQPLPRTFSADIHNLVQLCLTVEVEKRISIDKLIALPVIQR
jgi:NIMA (never in mitosis gene a)-related kinase